MTRLPITKTPKVYVGGAFIRSESGRTYPIRDASGDFYANIPQCTRKDLRNAVEAAAKSGPGWARRTAYNRGQILYRLGEMLEARSGELAEAIALGGGSPAAAGKEVAAAVDRLKSSGARLLNEPRPGAGGHLYVFVHPASAGGVLLELIQE